MPVIVGTSGYSYQDWKGDFYPRGIRPRELLPFYAERFQTVELNFSYYRMPRREQLARMAEETLAKNPGFKFSIKANRELTHKRGRDWEREAERFGEAVAVLRERGCLGAVLLQFPQSFHYTPANRSYLDRLIARLAPLSLACEFRSCAWLGPRVYTGLRERGVALAAVDEPQIKNLLPPLVIRTANIGYTRFHGRNAQAWWSGDSALRYDYLYNRDELEEWCRRLTGIAQDTSAVYVYFNNHRRAQAVANARQLRELLGE